MRHIFRKVFFVLAIVVVILNWTWGRLPKEPAAPADAKYAQVDGVNVHYQETPGRGPGVIMIHGHPGTYMDWNYVRTKLPGLRTVAIDRPGYGYSSGGYVDFDDQVTLIHDLAKKLGMKKPIIAGHSYGGTLAVAYAEKYPNSTTAVVPVDPALDPDGEKPLNKIQAMFVKALQVPVVRQVANATFNQALLTGTSKPQVEQAFSPDPANPDYDEQLKAVNLKHSDLETFADEELDFSGVVPSITPGLRDIRVPTFVIQGTGDKLVDPDSTRTATKKIPKAKYIALPGGHMQTWVHPDQVASTIRAAAR